LAFPIATSVRGMAKIPLAGWDYFSGGILKIPHIIPQIRTGFARTPQNACDQTEAKYLCFLDFFQANANANGLECGGR